MARFWELTAQGSLKSQSKAISCATSNLDTHQAIERLTCALFRTCGVSSAPGPAPSVVTTDASLILDWLKLSANHVTHRNLKSGVLGNEVKGPNQLQTWLISFFLTVKFFD